MYPNLDWLLSGLVQRVPYTRSAVLLSSDGLVKSVHGLDPDSADHMAALASGLYSLGRSAGPRSATAATVRQVVVELDSTLLFVSTAGSGTCLAVLAGREADAAVARLRDGDAGQERPAVPGHAGPQPPSAEHRGACDVPAPTDGPFLDDAAGRLSPPVHRQQRPDPADDRASTCSPW